jgi:DNA-3-methyladenine glycosylase
LYNIPVSATKRLSRSFFAQNTLDVARQLIGMKLVRYDTDLRMAGFIIETEAYRGEEDLGCHARAGLTNRTQVMYGPPGHTYVYFTYGMHWMLNFVTENEGIPAAVLIRALFPTEGLEALTGRRDDQPAFKWTNGPAKLCRAFGIDRKLNNVDLCTPDSPLFVEIGVTISPDSVTSGPRVGLYSVPEPWKSIPWRFRLTRLDLLPSG